MNRSELATALAGATDRGELFAVFQPQLDPASGAIIAAEALARWVHPVLGAVPTDEFIAAAEESGRITEVGDFMIEQGCAFTARLHDTGIRIAINVSALQLADRAFGYRLLKTAERHAITPQRLVIELTESQPVADVPDAVSQLRGLRDAGVGISIDDFGTGHSSLKQLEALPFTELKIDQSLIREDTDETWNRVAALVAIVRQRGMRIVAEGIETQDQYDRIRAAGCDAAQGYLLGMPMTADDFVAFYAASARTPLPLLLAATARKALALAGLRNMEDVATWRQRDVAALHGVGPRAMQHLSSAMVVANLAFQLPFDSPEPSRPR